MHALIIAEFHKIFVADCLFIISLSIGVIQEERFISALDEPKFQKKETILNHYGPRFLNLNHPF